MQPPAAGGQLHDAAERHLAQARTLVVPLANMVRVAVSIAEGIARQAARDLYGARTGFEQAVSIPLPAQLPTFAVAHLARVLAATGDGAGTLRQLARLEAEQARDVVRPISLLVGAVVARSDGVADRAEDLVQETLEHAHRFRLTIVTVDALELLAVLQADASPRNAARLLGAAHRTRQAIDYVAPGVGLDDPVDDIAVLAHEVLPVVPGRMAASVDTVPARTAENP